MVEILIRIADCLIKVFDYFLYSFLGTLPIQRMLLLTDYAAPIYSTHFVGVFELRVQFGLPQLGQRNSLRLYFVARS